MRWILMFVLWHGATTVMAQDAGVYAGQAPLPDSPGTARSSAQRIAAARKQLPPCKPEVMADTTIVMTAADAGTQPVPCKPESQSPYQRFLNSPTPFPLTARQKGMLAIHDLVDPGNLITITGNAAVTVGVDPRTAYGPGWRGFGRATGYSLVQDATGEFVSTFALDSLFHEDPHYHRLPDASVPRRLLHAVSHTVRSQHDDGRSMINVSTLLTYPISAEISNLYVPGVHTNAPSTMTRIVTGLATDPVDSLITEFLPDFAKRVHVRIIFVQQILNNIASGQEI